MLLVRNGARGWEVENTLKFSGHEVACPWPSQLSRGWKKNLEARDFKVLGHFEVIVGRS